MARTLADFARDEYILGELSDTVEVAQGALERLHRTHDERWPARMCDLCRPIAEALALFDETVEVD